MASVLAISWGMMVLKIASLTDILFFIIITICDGLGEMTFAAVPVCRWMGLAPQRSRHKAPAATSLLRNWQFP